MRKLVKIQWVIGVSILIVGAIIGCSKDASLSPVAPEPIITDGESSDYANYVSNGYDCRDYTPPKSTGYIYTVIQYKWKGITASNTYVSVKWGGWSKNATVNVPWSLFTTPAGFVLKLQHKNADSYRLTVCTDGKILTAPSQGQAPKEWNKTGYKQVSW